MKLTIATCQFPVSANILKNTNYILHQIKSAKESKADVVHFPEASLSGYAGADMESLKGMNWSLLRQSTKKIMQVAKELEIWVVLGSTHQLSGNHKPHNSLYIINEKGMLVDRYDKMFCAGDEQEKTGDLAHYSSGNHLAIFTIKGVRCGAQICHDYRYPELYREYKRRGVQVIFHSYHAANIKGDRLKAMQSVVSKDIMKFNQGRTYPEITMPATMVSYAANNYVWISCSNSSAKESCWASFFVRPDGVITGKLRRNVSGTLISNVDTEQEYYDSTKAWRDRAIEGIFHSGSLVEDSKSENRTTL
ncbi:carbon-nitrogen hydrolase family protein [Evansella halocellulosilytica]|uniref:carbon-nitrogen hydrolase family protein n=1 Tax=Evansella halocellulosilytica TaxID=2011013 RepID=UPI000BB89A05|nr:carbon-nitrogen hydrolase family protein [Evansella halocellulosilytica]